MTVLQWEPSPAPDPATHHTLLDDGQKELSWRPHQQVREVKGKGQSEAPQQEHSKRLSFDPRHSTGGDRRDAKGPHWDRIRLTPGLENGQCSSSWNFWWRRLVAFDCHPRLGSLGSGASVRTAVVFSRKTLQDETSNPASNNHATQILTTLKHGAGSLASPCTMVSATVGWRVHHGKAIGPTCPMRPLLDPAGT